jgi:hypothetical protein
MDKAKVAKVTAAMHTLMSEVQEMNLHFAGVILDPEAQEEGHLTLTYVGNVGLESAVSLMSKFVLRVQDPETRKVNWMTVPKVNDVLQ